MAVQVPAGFQFQVVCFFIDYLFIYPFFLEMKHFFSSVSKVESKSSSFSCCEVISDQNLRALCSTKNLFYFLYYSSMLSKIFLAANRSDVLFSA